MKVLVAATVTVLAAALVAGCTGGPGTGRTRGEVVLAVLNDQSGVYADVSGKGSVTAVELAVADFQAKYGQEAVVRSIDVISADHQNKPEIASSKAAELYDRRHADVILDVPTSSAALAVADQAKSHQKLFIAVSPATNALDGDKCNKYTFHYGFNVSVLAHTTGTTVTQDGGKNWYIVYPDYVYGKDMNQAFTSAIEAAGGTVVKSDPAPFPNDDFSTFLLKASALSPKPQVLGTMQAGGDLVNLVKQYNEYRLRDQGIGLAVGLMFLTDIASLGPDVLAGTKFTDPWYWNTNETTRAWADRFQAKTGKRPTFIQAANYSAALQYLEGLQRAGGKPDAVIKQLEGAKVNDVFARNGTIRAADHVLVHDVNLAQVKPAAAVSEPWDYERILKTVPGEEAFAPASPACKL